MRLSLLVFSLAIVNLCATAQQVPLRYELVKMDKNVNTFRHEAAPVVSPDGNTLYFFVQNHPENTLGKDDTQDIWVSKKDANGVWSLAQHLSSPFNLHRSNQVFTVFPDGSLFIKGGRGKDKGFSIVNGSSLQEVAVKDFNNMNKGRFYGASMSADRKHIIMYFSEVANSVNSDLYASHQQADGSFTRPVKLKLSTNTDDVGPFIDPDQQTMYFASARQAPGRQGGVDIYKTKRLDDTWMNWSEPINLGKPINTSALDYYFTVDQAGNVFTSRANKALDGGQLDLYALVPKTIKIKLAGLVYNAKTMQPIQSATVGVSVSGKDPVNLQTSAGGSFETTIAETLAYTVDAASAGFLPKKEPFTIPVVKNDTTINIEILLTPVAKKLILAGNVYDKKTEQLISAKVDIGLKGDRKTNQSFRAEGGKFEKEIPKLGWYLVSASAEGYINANDSISIEDDGLSPFTRDLYLQPIEVGVTVRLKNIYFDFDKTTLKKESFVELDKVVEFLKQNPSVEIEIAGHTDNKGADDYNVNLSQGRSQSVVDYIVSQGIESFRLEAHGYGEALPIDNNDTELGRANNRRVDFTVMKK